MQASQYIDFKRQWKDDLLKEVCAFANFDGGVLMLGYNDRGEAVGLEYIEKLLEDIPNKIRDVLGIVVEVNLVIHQRLHTLHIQTDAYPYPVSYKGEYHYRSGSTKQELKGAALEKFMMRKHGITWDSVPVPHVTTDDLGHKALKLFRQQAVRKQRLPELLHQGNTMTRDDLADAISVSTNAIKQHLANLQKDNLLKREGGRKQGYWTVIRPPC